MEDDTVAASPDELALGPTELVETPETVGDDHDHAEGRGLPVARLVAAVVTTTELADNAVTSAKILDGTIVNADVNSAAAILVSKLAAGGTANRVIATTDGATTAWQQVTAAMIATDTITSAQLGPDSVTTSELAVDAVIAENIDDGAVTDVKMAAQKVNQVSPQYTTFGGATPLGSGLYDIAGSAGDAPVAGRNGWLLSQVRHWNWEADYRWQWTCAMDDSTMLYSRSIIAGAGSAWQRLWHSGNDGSGSTLDADLLDGNSSAFYATSAALTAETAARTSAIAAIASVPSGLIAAFRTAGAIAAGWTRFTDGDGRVLIGAGTTFSVTFTENTVVGSSWSHQHAATGLTATSGAIALTETGGFVAAAAASNNPTSATNVATGEHTHPAPTVAMGGTTANVAWQVPARIVVFAIKS